MGGGTPPNPTLNKTRPKKITGRLRGGWGGRGGVPPHYRSRNVVDYVGGSQKILISKKTTRVCLKRIETVENIFLGKKLPRN